ncbi:flagellar brake protein [Pseudomonas sp. 5P_3.1_Bac2]|uniref:flagellar brake protein n=1 Tax=Pseudomonas sp. 5P_3.1_Bac2 TaxID=2971617 RepID=UPI0021C96FFF|nr:flagellar brake protein [Pseudomonas sp. 5P_3.1_Bac2]MCU1715786.1 flagellar brake protein [Pseudomonas sp. 5P_3.1_Bac2]
MSSPFNQEDGPQPPKLLKAPVEIVANLRLLQQHHDPLVISFEGRSQRFQSFVIEVDRDKALVTLDELVPAEGERYLLNGETFNAEAFHEGVRIAWKSSQSIQATEQDGARCYLSSLPSEMIYHQRRSAYRAALKLSELINVDLADDKLKKNLSGQLLDISATGCKLRFSGDLSDSLSAGQLFASLTAKFPFGPMITAVEIRHVHYEEKVKMTFVGARFDNINGQAQRAVERFVYQLQREARRLEGEGLF